MRIDVDDDGARTAAKRRGSGNPWKGREQRTKVDTVVTDVSRIGDIAIPSDGTKTIYVRDLGTVSDSSDIEFGYALVNGQHTVFIPVTKRADASTLSVVNLMRENIPKFQAVLPEGAKVTYEFDQSPFVSRAISGLTQEGAIGAVLTGLMVLLFLRDWRSALVVVVNIPLSIMAAMVALWATGQTVNLMTLGGLALAVGILVDEATVASENLIRPLALLHPQEVISDALPFRLSQLLNLDVPKDRDESEAVYLRPLPLSPCLGNQALGSSY
ncbi:MAG: efflux RND transporter permease subunit [Methylocystis sp.]|uniref:efflux RND transporter permease subunit n=1 Tax=Methylocystis sp. TaxID=1911079 RepID=UPI003DA1CA2A